MRIIILLTTICIMIINGLYADYIGTGAIEWTQPEGTTFIAKLWGDEFEHWMETDDGYRIVKGSGKFYYYAQLDSSGEFTPSSYKVGIDVPLASAYQLDRSESRKAEIEAQIEIFNQQLEQNAIWYQQRRETREDPIKLGVVLVDFTPNERHPIEVNNPIYPNPYSKSHFDNLMFSTDYWTGVHDPEGDETLTPHPESHELFGSFRDYYNQQSCGNLDIYGRGATDADNGNSIVNRDVGGLPEWVVLDEPKEFYYGDHLDFELREIFVNDVITKASSMDIDLSQYEKLVFVIAGDRGSGILWPNTFQNNYIASERNITGFEHIGVHAHEFGHLLGAKDEYFGDYHPGKWEVMASGSNNGPNEGSCPAGFSPFYRINWGWITPIIIENNVNDLNITYSYNNPIYYQISIEGTDESFILENRLRESFDFWTPNNPTFDYQDENDPNENLGGLLIWNTLEANTLFDAVKLIRADNDNDNNQNMSRDPFPYFQNDENGSGENLNSSTHPSSDLRNGMYSGVSINNISWNDDLTTTVDIVINDAIDVINSDQVWSNVQTVSKHIIVEEGVTLTINPGTTINIGTFSDGSGPYFIFKPGSHLVAVGNNSNPIEFSSILSSPSPGNWGGLVFEYVDLLSSHDDHQLNYCIFRHTETALTYDNTIHMISSSFGNLSFIDNIQVFNVSQDYIGANIVFDNCYFDNSKFDLTDYPLLSTTVSNCHFKNSLIDFGRNPNNYNSDINFHHNIVEANDIGIYVTSNGQNYRTVDIINNTFIDNSIGVMVRSSNGGVIPLSIDVRNNCFYSDQINTGIQILGISQLIIREIDYNNFYNDSGDGETGENALFVEPQFLDVNNANYHLSYESQLKDAGDPDSPLDPDESTSDIGAFYYPNNGSMVTYNANWNIVGLPREVESSFYLDVYSNAVPNTCTVYENGSYISANNLIRGDGYWLKFYGDGAELVLGDDALDIELIIEEGWNLISGTSRDCILENITDSDNILLPGCFYGYENGFFESERIIPGKGYWVRASQPGTITITNTPFTPNQFTDRMDDANYVKFTNNTGKERKVYFGVEVPEEEQLSYTLPPLPPDEVMATNFLDARYSDQKKYTETSGNIELRNTDYPLTVEYGILNDDEEWEISSNAPKRRNGDEEYGDIRRVKLNRTGTIVFEHPIESFTIRKTSTNNLPTEFALKQNYPNPFNPETVIRYQLPVISIVQLTVYDLMGRTVKELVNGNTPAGTHHIIWNGTDTYGKPVASGMYLYQLKVSNKILTKKLVMLK